MTQSVTCETATLADAINKASRVAPTKGAAWDKAMGIQLEVRPGTAAPLRVRATDLESTYFQRVATVAVGDETCDWRVPNQLLAGFLTGLPMSAGKQVTLTSDGRILVVKSGRSTSKIRLLVDRLPDFPLFAADGMESVSDFARRVSNVSWAVEKGVVSSPLGGVHIDGEHLIACDRTRVVFLPCKVPVSKPVTAPMGKLASLLRQLDTVKLRATETRLEIMPDDDTQLTCQLFAAEYPNMRGVLSHDVPYKIAFEKAPLMDALNRMLVLVKSERYPKLKMTFNGDEFTMEMLLEDVGEMNEVISIKSDLPEEVTMWVTPDNLRDASMNSPRDKFVINTNGNPDKPIRFTDESGYEAWIMPLRVS